MSDRVRLGLVGAGVAAQAIHLPVLLRRPDLFRVCAICDASQAVREAVADRCGVDLSRCHERTEQMLDAAGLDALLVLSSGSHGAACALATAAGLPVLCEKPLAYTTAEADALATAGARIALGYMKLYDPAVKRAAELLAGRVPRSVEVVVLHPPVAAQLAHLRLVASDDIPAARRVVLEEEELRLLEGALGPVPTVVQDLYRWKILGSIVHDLAVVRVLAGAPTRWDRVDAWPPGAPTSVSLDGVLPGGGRLSIRWHLLAEYPLYREEVRVHDEQGTVQVTFPSPYLLSPGATLTVVDRGAGESSRTSIVSPFEAELVAFHRLVTADEPTEAGVAEGRADIEICQRALKVYCEANGLMVGGEAART
jgi:myo-inositol 2-dehydrogenase / D-chiro-inositol 1-dehydrogenase